jgi:hypothetical protein
LPRRFGTTDTRWCGGDSRKLKAVVAFRKQINKQHKRLRTVVDILHRVRLEGGAFDYSFLAAGPVAAVPDSGAGAGSVGSVAASSSGAESGQHGAPAAVVALDARLERLSKRLTQVDAEQQNVGQLTWHATHYGDADQRAQLTRRWYGLNKAKKELERSISRCQKLRIQRQREAAAVAEAALVEADGDGGEGDGGECDGGDSDDDVADEEREVGSDGEVSDDGSGSSVRSERASDSDSENDS